MVLRKDQEPKRFDNSNNFTNMSHEQPVTKRQRIENSVGGVNPSNVDDGGGGSNEISPPSTVANNSPSTPSASVVVSQNEEISTVSTLNIVSPVDIDDNELKLFYDNLSKQCLCGLNERILKKPYQKYYTYDINGIKKSTLFIEWPIHYLQKFLSNIQLLFDIYLNQNSKGHICSRIMELCDVLIQNHNNLIDDILDLINVNNNKFINYLAGRVITYFLIIIKDEIDHTWLKRIVDNLFLFENLDYLAVKKINFSLEIIKHIVEWKDHNDMEHPLEEDLLMSEHNILPPPIENNYFATSFLNSEFHMSSSSASAPSSSNRFNTRATSSSSSGHGSGSSTSSNSANSSSSSSTENIIPTDCQIVTLTDSESFDTTHIKCVTIKILENKWPALVKNMSSLILSQQLQQQSNSSYYSENCILTFLNLWENIISVKNNLSIVETLPFYAQLHKFELLLNPSKLTPIIYKEMLTLFNEALCYGSTLALQDLLPEETCNLAHQIVRHVKDYSIFQSLPRTYNTTNTNNSHNIDDNNLVSLIGTNNVQSINYHDNSFQMINTHDTTTYVRNIDKTLLQKMALLVLKSVAVTVKETRSDSSDSSIDSTDYEALEDMKLIERSIRDALEKLERFIKSTLEFHPESHFSKILIHLFDDQDDYLIEAMVCTLDVTSGISFRNNAFPELVAMLNPVLTFLEFLKMISNSSELLLDLLVSNETCFLLYLLRFLKYIRLNWSMFVQSCRHSDVGGHSSNVLDDTMSVLIRLRLQISRLVAKSLYPYDIAPVLRLLESCESLYEGNELS